MAFELQGHRGARGLRPENTLPSFEIALDLGVTSIETDLHLTRDDVPVLTHDPEIAATIDGCRVRHPIRALTVAELRRFRVAANPDPARFPDQLAEVTPLAERFARERGFDPFAVPTLDDLLGFVAAYAGAPGADAGKSPAQQLRARQVKLDLELKRVPLAPETIGDDFDGATAGMLERQVAATLRAASAVERCVVRSFDHRSVRAIGSLEPCLTTAVLMDGVAPVAPGAVAQAAGATLYCPALRFVDAQLVAQAHAAGVRVLPWTANEPAEWQRLCACGVDGITTDYPDRLAAWLAQRGIAIT